MYLILFAIKTANLHELNKKLCIRVDVIIVHAIFIRINFHKQLWKSENLSFRHTILAYVISDVTG